MPHQKTTPHPILSLLTWSIAIKSGNWYNASAKTSERSHDIKSGRPCVRKNPHNQYSWDIRWDVCQQSTHNFDWQNATLLERSLPYYYGFHYIRECAILWNCEVVWIQGIQWFFWWSMMRMMTPQKMSIWEKRCFSHLWQSTRIKISRTNCHICDCDHEIRKECTEDNCDVPWRPKHFHVTYCFCGEKLCFSPGWSQWRCESAFNTN